jgi:ElaB/YqjD/DUF883 family membrane-anchored ribosome-binding protein
MNRTSKEAETQGASSERPRKPRRQAPLTEKRARRTSELEDLSRSAEEGLSNAMQALEEQVRERPYVTLAAALGAGVVLGQALHSRVGRLALLAAGGFAATRLLQGDGARLLERVLGTDVDDEDFDDELADVVDANAH